MTRYLVPVLCVLSTASCSTNKPADAPRESALNEALPPTAPQDNPPVSDARVGDSEPRATDTTHAGDVGSARRAAGPASTKPGPTSSDAAPARSDSETNANPAPDNTQVNERDTKSSALTPLDQGEGQKDLDITKKIRQAVVGDRSLSFTAKNVKIITRDGKVTLRGPVSTSDERSAIQSAAEKVAGAANVDNQLEVKK